jgi:SAM-dependent methyltransferase
VPEVGWAGCAALGDRAARQRLDYRCGSARGERTGKGAGVVENSEAWNERYRGEQRLWIRDPDPALMELVDTLSPGRALDLACGEGRNALALAQRGFEVIAVDFSAVALERLATSARELGLEIATVQADLREFLLEPPSADLVVLANFHPPREERLAIYRGLRAAVAPGGTLFLIGHHQDSLGIAGPPDPDRLLDEDEITESFRGWRLARLERLVEITDSGQEAPSLVAVIER